MKKPAPSPLPFQDQVQSRMQFVVKSKHEQNLALMTARQVGLLIGTKKRDSTWDVLPQLSSACHNAAVQPHPTKQGKYVCHTCGRLCQVK